MNENEENLDFVGIIKVIWNRRKLLALTTAIVMSLGLIWSLLSPKEYVADITILSDVQTGGQRFSNVRSLASLAGINVNSNNSSQDVSPLVYNEILKSLPFQQAILKAKVDSDKYGNNITVSEYLLACMKDNNKLKLRKYTLGLPKTILKSINRKTPKLKDNSIAYLNQVYSLSGEEAQSMSLVYDALSLTIDSENGTISMTCLSPEPLPSAQILQHSKSILEKIVKEFKTSKLENQLKFIQQLFEQKKIEYETVQKELAEFQDANRIISNSIGFSEQQRLQDKYNLAYNIYTEVASQLESKKIEVQENTPVFSVVQPVIKPRKPIGPNHIQNILVSLFLGLFLGLFFVFAIETKIYLMKNW